MSELSVVWFERRSSLCLGAIRREGPKKLTLIDEQGDTTRIQRGRVVVTLSSRVSAKDAGAQLVALRRSWGDVAVPDEEELWASLPDVPIDFSELARIQFGEQAGDAELFALACGLTAGEGAETGQLRASFFVREGAILRRPAAQRTQIRRRQELADQEVRLRTAVAAWWEGPRSEAPAAELIDVVNGLKEYALAGDKADDHQRSARIAKRIGIETPDQLLIALEARGVLPRHTNEQPTRLGLPLLWNAEARAEAQLLAVSSIDEQGEDLRDVSTIAIDAAGADEIDDALSVLERDGRRYLAIHIANPEIAIGGALDAATASRATSVYFARETVPMLPEAVTGRFGLLAGQDREAVTYLAPLGDDGLPEPGRFLRSRIRVDRHLEFSNAMDDPLGAEILAVLGPVAVALHAQRVEAGAFLHRSPNLKIEFDGEGQPVPQLLSVEGSAQLVVSELMILHNAQLAAALAEADRAAFFRVQAKALPPARALDDVFEILQARRSLPPTRVQVDSGPQRTMGVAGYVQGSSPLRRYGDLIAQRQLLSVVDGRVAAYSEDDVRELLAELPKRERRARQAEDERQRYHLARWLARNPRFTGRLSRRGSRASVFLDAWQRDLPARLKHDDARTVGEWVEVEVVRAVPRAPLELRILVE
ncbi:MAG: RNB domain-containing ribonuclease [Planctomycetes bacterium]|nr:RNB domain-containing ribonuclease [Planctomycetota bacterium]